MAYKPLSALGLGIYMETFDPELEGKYIGRYKKVSKTKDGESSRDGWLIWPTVNKKRYHEFFMDKSHQNSPAESLVAAIKRRNEVLDLKEDDVPFQTDIISSNVSGRNGVSFAKTRYKKGAKGQQVVHQSACWCATWSDVIDGKRKTTCKKFSVKKYGFWQAYRLAVHARWQWENEVRDRMGMPVEDTFGITRADWMEEQNFSAKEFQEAMPAEVAEIAQAEANLSSESKS